MAKKFTTKRPGLDRLVLSVNDELLDKTIRHATLIERFKSHEVKKVLSILDKDIIPDLESKLEVRLGRIVKKGFDPSPRATKQLQDQLDQFRILNDRVYNSLHKTVQGDLLELAQVEEAWSAKTLKDALPFDYSVKLPSAQALRSVVNSRPFQGSLLKDWFGSLKRSQQTRIERAVRQGLVEGESIQQIGRRLKGVFGKSRREVESVIRTAVNHTSTQARELVYAENTEIIKGVQIIATLDARTTDICMSLDGQVFKPAEGPRPPFHHQCRTTTVPVTKSWRELGIPANKVSASTRASMDGQVSAKITYPEWLKKMGRSKDPAKRALVPEALGVGRAKVFMRGNLKIDKFVDVQGHPIPLKELAKKEGLKVKTRQKPKPKRKLTHNEGKLEVAKQVEDLTQDLNKVLKRLGGERPNLKAIQESIDEVKRKMRNLQKIGVPFTVDLT